MGRSTSPEREQLTEAPRTVVAAADTPPGLPRRGLLDRDWQKALVVLLTVLAGLALLWVLWQVLSPISHTLILFGLAAVLAFALSGPVDMLSTRIGNRLLAIVAVYLLVGIVVVGGLTLLAGPFVRDVTALTSALPQYAADVQARAPEVQSTLGQYGVQTDLDQLKTRVVAAVEQGGTDVLKNLVGTLAEVGGIILDIVLALVISLYLLIDGPRFRTRSLALVPAEHRGKALFLEDHVSRVLGGYLRGLTRTGRLPARTAHPGCDYRRGGGRGHRAAGLAVRGGARGTRRTVRAGADVWTNPVGRSSRYRCAVPALPNRGVGHLVLFGRSADRK